ncbi:hypothetical protein J4212_06050 [Candidatus Woesearchaeota archaeon]|nr:hypothetical protein [Candidatus Woesearchaeota archaeon]
MPYRPGASQNALELAKKIRELEIAPERIFFVSESYEALQAAGQAGILKLYSDVMKGEGIRTRSLVVTDIINFLKLV